MAEKPITALRCPICKKDVKAGDPNSPFCSERCRTIDLGKWASGAYSIPSAVPDEEERLQENTPGRERDED
ncbi:MAG TPA: DNA gyrase inhibitor YacG [Candidatus Sulfotelmatobacter sp.]|jgi:hypothetical protein